MNLSLFDPPLVPVVTMEELVKLILDKFLIQYGIQLNQDFITTEYITPRETFEDCLKLTYTVPNEPILTIGCYIKYNYKHDFIINDFRLEYIKDEVGLTPPPQTDPTAPTQPLPSLPEPPPTLPPPSTVIPVVSFTQSNFTVPSGQQLILNIDISSIPSLNALVDAINQDGTAIEGISYSFSPSTVSWAPGDTTAKGVIVNTGIPYYYYWKPAQGYDLNNSNSSITKSSLDVEIQNITNDVLYIGLSSPIKLPLNNDLYYHEFEFTNQNFVNSVTFEININALELNSNNPVITNSGIILTPDQGTGNLVIGLYSPNFYNTDISFPFQLTKPYRIGFLFNKNFETKLNINGYWIDLNNANVSQDVNNVAFSQGFDLNPNTIITRIAGYTYLNPSSDLSDNFTISGKVNNNQLYRPNNVPETGPNFLPSNNLGTFTINLVNPVNNTINISTATIDIIDGNVCFSKLLIDNNKTGFIGASINETNDYSLPKKFVGKLSWNTSSSTCGSFIDTRLTAQRNQPYQQAN